jgi:hypothetical protein
MPLLTISDLDQPFEVLKAHYDRVQQLGSMYSSYIASDDDTYTYNVFKGSSSSRAVGIHASEVSGCLRRLVYGVAGFERRVAPESNDVNMQMRFRLGTAAHAMLQNDWQRIAKKTGGWLSFEDEVHINPSLQPLAEEWNIHSSCDGIFIFHDSAGQQEIRVGLEIKTEANDGYTSLTSPRPKHIEQTHVYMAVLDLPLMWLLYYNKNNSNFMQPYAPFLFKFDKNLWENTLSIRFAKAHHLAGQRILPDKDEGFDCKWCPFSYHCQPTFLKSKAAPAKLSPQMFPRRV